jgi:hypothetical protein
LFLFYFELNFSCGCIPQFLAGFLSEAFLHTHSFVRSVLKRAFDSKFHESVTVIMSDVDVNVPEIQTNQLFQLNIPSADNATVKAEEATVFNATSHEPHAAQNDEMVLVASVAAAAPMEIELTRPTSTPFQSEPLSEELRPDPLPESN